MRRWAERNAIDCYRIYDADLPEYAVAIDRYRDWVHVAEYRAPASVPAEKAAVRLADVVASLPAVLEVPSHRIVLKARERQRGSLQYERREARGALLEVREGPARLLVNLTDYLDTGLFLDHRSVRRKLAALASGKRFANLYCYTGAATVHSALGGASQSVSVDLSSTYLGWAEKNFALNGLDRRRHRLERADCRAWLERGRSRFDLVLLDPPTFSNSKSRAETLDIQRDHLALIEAAMRRLAPGGVLVFSTNRRRFELDPTLLRRFSIEDWTRATTDRDFERSRAGHRVWLIHGEALPESLRGHAMPPATSRSARGR